MTVRLHGFTLIELLLAMAITAVLFGISSIVLSSLIPRANRQSVTEILAAEVRQQQLKAIVGEKNADDDADEYGVHIESQRYTLFQGDSYDANAVSNTITEVPNSIQLSASPQTIVFSRGSGEILNYSSSHSITITDTLTTESSILTLNSYGVLE